VVAIHSHGILPANFSINQPFDPCESRFLQGSVNVAYHLNWIQSNLDVTSKLGDKNKTISKTYSLLTRGWQLLTHFFRE
jgi:hypothetical protein